MFTARALSSGLRMARGRYASTSAKASGPAGSSGQSALGQNAHRARTFKEASLSDAGVYPILICLGCGAALAGAQLVRYLAFSPDVKLDRQKRSAEIPNDAAEGTSWMHGLRETLRGKKGVYDISIPPFKN